MTPSTRSIINMPFRASLFLQMLQENGHTDDECYKLHEFLKNATLVTSPHFKSKGDSFNNNTIATTSTNIKLYLVSKFSQFAHEQYHQINFWNWVYYWMNIKYIDETYLYINRIYN